MHVEKKIIKNCRQSERRPHRLSIVVGAERNSGNTTNAGGGAGGSGSSYRLLSYETKHTKRVSTNKPQTTVLIFFLRTSMPFWIAKAFILVINMDYVKWKLRFNRCLK